jgi:hypothetical protein
LITAAQPSLRHQVLGPRRRFQAGSHNQTPITREEQLIFFFRFLQAAGRWEEFLRECPLHCAGIRGISADYIVDTILLSALNGHWRYAQRTHIFPIYRKQLSRRLILW